MDTAPGLMDWKGIVYMLEYKDQDGDYSAMYERNYRKGFEEGKCIGSRESIVMLVLSALNTLDLNGHASSKKKGIDSQLAQKILDKYPETVRILKKYPGVNRENALKYYLSETEEYPF